jgi:hypothetical protein
MSIFVSCMAVALVSTTTSTSPDSGTVVALTSEPPQSPRQMWGLELMIGQHVPLVDSSIFFASGENEAGRGQTFGAGVVWWLPGPNLQLGVRVVVASGGLRLAPWRAGDSHQPLPALGAGLGLSVRKTLMLTDLLWLSARPSLLARSSTIRSRGPCIATDEAGPVRCIDNLRQSATMGAFGASMSVELGLGAADASQRKEIFVALDYSVLNFSSPSVQTMGPDALPQLKMVPGGVMHSVGLSVGGYWSGVVSVVRSDVNNQYSPVQTYDRTDPPVHPPAND